MMKTVPVSEALIIHLGRNPHRYLEYTLVSAVMYAFIRSVNKCPFHTHGVPVTQDTKQGRQGPCSITGNLLLRETGKSKQSDE